LRNCVEPEVGKHILNCCLNIVDKNIIKQNKLF